MPQELEFVVAIPARFGASRLPGKPLREIAGEPMIAHVARRALASGADVVVATDDARIRDALSGLPLTVVMTRAGHVSGTDRIAECAARLGWPDDRIVVNLQGDEPFAPVEGIRAVASALSESASDVATLAIPFDDPAQLFDPNVVKVVRNAAGSAMYFTRAPVPWHRDRLARDRTSALPSPALRHIGIYAYRAGFLRRLADMPASALEKTEALEQLRVLEAGFSIRVALSPVPFPPGVDTEQDLQEADRRARA